VVMSDQEKPAGLERDRPPGEPRSWELGEAQDAAPDKRWVRIVKTLLLAVWITLLVVGTTAAVLILRNSAR
jgi:hypothetical protein